MAIAKANAVCEYVEKFLREHGDEDILGAWKENIEGLRALILPAPKPRDTNPDRPKKHSAYQLYCAAHRDAVKAAHQKWTNAQITKQLAADWKKLQASTKKADKKEHAEFVRAAEAEKAAYEEEMKTYETPAEFLKVPKQRKAGRKLDPDRPKKLSAYQLYCQDHREEVKEELGEGVKGAEVTKELAKRWRAVKEEGGEEFKEYEAMAVEMKAEYEEAMKTYEVPEGFDAPAPRKARAKAPKDPNRPKKLTAYQLYCRDNREGAKEELGEGATAKEVLSELARMWAEVKEEDGDDYKEYQDLAAAEKARWEEEMKGYTPPTVVEKPSRKTKGKGKAKADPNRPKKLTAYQLYCQDNRQVVKDDGFEGREVTTELGRRWKEMKEANDDDYQHYQQLGEEAKARWEEEMAAYNATEEGDAL
jgi:hypothetical protein